MISAPYGKRPRYGIQKVIADRTMYFKKMGGLTVNEQPDSAQELKAIKDEMNQLLLLIGECIQKDYSVSIEVAYIKALLASQSFFVNQAKKYKEHGQTIEQIKVEQHTVSDKGYIIFVPENTLLYEGDWLLFDKTVFIINKPIERGVYQVETTGVQIPEGSMCSRININIFDYASESEVERIQELTKASSNVAIDAATLFMQYRVLFPVEDVSSVDAGATMIRLPELNVELQKGDRIKFPKTEGYSTVIVTVSDYARVSDNDEEDVAIAIEKCPGPIPEGATGFVMNGRELRAGTAWEVLEDSEFYQISLDEQKSRINATWPEFQTRSFSDEMTAAIFEFHQSESNAKTSKSLKDDEPKTGNGGNSSSKSEPKSQLNGKSITGESKVTKSTIKGSTSKTLDAANVA